MPYRYIREIATGNILTAGYITADHPVPDGFEMVDGEPPQGAIQYDGRPLTEKATQALLGLLKTAAAAGFNKPEKQELALMLAVCLAFAQADDLAGMKEYIQDKQADFRPPVRTAFNPVIALFP